MARSIVAKVCRMVREEGLLKTALAVGRYAWEQTPWGQEAPTEFDLRHGVDTGGKIPLRRLTIDSPNAEFGSRYQPVQPDAFSRLMAGIPEALEGFTFIDLGSGKGRALLMASDYPFQKIVGVEFASELHRIATRNVQIYRSPTQKCRDIELLLLDATAYPIPSGPLVVFIYNPFQGEVMANVVANIRASIIRASIQSYRRPLYVTYYYPQGRGLFDACPELEVIGRDHDFVIYRARSFDALSCLVA